MAVGFYFFFFKQKTAYEITRRDWSSDVCSSDLEHLLELGILRRRFGARAAAARADDDRSEERRVGKECALLCRSRWSPGHEKKKDEVLGGCCAVMLRGVGLVCSEGD